MKNLWLKNIKEILFIGMSVTAWKWNLKKKMRKFNFTKKKTLNLPQRAFTKQFVYKSFADLWNM